MKCDSCKSQTCVTTFNRDKYQHLCENCINMALSVKQQKFALYVSILVQYINSQGYGVTYGDAYAKTGHKVKSKHYQRLAVDFNLFKNGKYLTETEDWEQFGLFWESLDEECIWGGMWGDGNHFQYGHG